MVILYTSSDALKRDASGVRLFDDDEARDFSHGTSRVYTKRSPDHIQIQIHNIFKEY